MMRRMFVPKCWLVCAPLIAACSSPEKEPVSGRTLALTAQQNVERTLRGAHQAGSFIADSAVLAKALSGAASKDCAPTAACPVGAPCLPVEPQCEDAVTVDQLKETRRDLSDAIDDLLKTLREDVFTPENLESEDGTYAVYLLGPDVICKNSEVDVSSPAPAPGGNAAALPAPEPALDRQCVERARKLEPRLQLSAPSPGSVEVALLLTAQKRKPATLELRPDGVDMQLDLGEIKAALDAAGEPTDSLAAMSGKVKLELQRNAENDYSFRVDVLSTLGLGIVDALEQRIDIGLTASTPTFELRLDGNARQVSGTYDYGALSVHGPLGAFRDDTGDTYDASGNATAPKTYSGTIDALLAGVEGGITLAVDGERDHLALTGVGLGDEPSTLKFDGATVAQLELNPSAGRHFDLTLDAVAENQTAITFSPTFDLNLLLNFAPLANQISDLPAYALGDTLRLWFDGANPSVRSESEQLRVLSGTLNLTSKATPQANLQVSPGSCLLDAPEGAATATNHELLGRFVAGACK
jgi:hypothetical protein